jgi:hypothetical protein
VRHPFRRKNLRARLLPLYVGVLAALALARPTAPGLLVGGVLLAAGLGLRAWGAGHLWKTRELVASGPYAHLRHPLYAGALLMGTGFAVAAGPRALAGLVLAGLPLFFGYYLPYKERVEGARLERRFGTAAVAYRAAVPALLPSFPAWRPPARLGVRSDGAWSALRYRDNHELGTLCAALLGFALLVARGVLLP